MTHETCTCLERPHCQLCGASRPLNELWATPYTAAPGERELYWCIDCGGDGAVLYHCSTCEAEGQRWAA